MTWPALPAGQGGHCRGFPSSGSFQGRVIFEAVLSAGIAGMLRGGWIVAPQSRPRRSQSHLPAGSQPRSLRDNWDRSVAGDCEGCALPSSSARPHVEDRGGPAAANGDALASRA